MNSPLLTAKQAGRSAARKARRNTLQDRDGLIRPADLERAIWTEVCAVGTGGGMERDERDELTARLAVVAAETIVEVRESLRLNSMPDELRQSDREWISAAIGGAVERTRREYRRELGLQVLDPEAGTGDMIHAAEQAALRRSRSMNRTMGKIGPDPAEPWLREAATGLKAGDRALVLSAAMPMITDAEWSAAEKVPADRFKERRADAIKSAKRSAAKVERLSEPLRTEPPHTDPIAALLRFIGPAPLKSGKALPMVDIGHRDYSADIGRVTNRKRLRPVDRKGPAVDYSPRPIKLAPITAEQVRLRREQAKARAAAMAWIDRPAIGANGRPMKRTNREAMAITAKRRAAERVAAEERDRLRREGKTDRTTGRPVQPAQARKRASR